MCLRVDPKFFQAQFNLAIAYRAVRRRPEAHGGAGCARAIAGDDATRQRVDALLARLDRCPAGRRRGRSSRLRRGGADLHDDVEAIFRSALRFVGCEARPHRLAERADHARVVLRDFPMDGMPPMVRDKFIDAHPQRRARREHGNQTHGRRTIELVDTRLAAA